MESWVGLGGEEGRTNIQISAEPGLNRGLCGWKAEILLTAPTMPAYLVRARMFLPMLKNNLSRVFQIW